MNRFWEPLRMFIVFICIFLCFPAHATTNEGEFTEEMGSNLAEKLRETASQFDSELSEEEKAMYYELIPMHLHNLYYTDEWQRFGCDLDNCDSIESVRKIFNEKYIGITEAATDRLQRQTIISIANKILHDSKLDLIFQYVFYGPLYAATPNTEGWNILGASASWLYGGTTLDMTLTKSGNVLTINALPSYDYEKSQRLQEHDVFEASEFVTLFSEAYAPYSGNANRPELLSEYSFTSTGMDEPVAIMWVQYDSAENISPLNDENYGDFYVIGISTKQIYYYRSFLSMEIAYNIVTEDADILSLP